ncbi:hypothetical protein BDBG_17276 [Blastomyces gilchristii SLH14081]|uniref:Uncharacterized protein n=1 Tax=Blastomyces gilchristii (strain SLH14081) TaxID=559298 RepID=A0A179UP55_BLAGS|nr:uncharacterized protein BDBG_17276 [Blastomyces gilchristii SLH14081]OAT09866.1 hypothetical protein BDBG_17276 [Blastomyces gilchristii SLH14081]
MILPFKPFNCALFQSTLQQSPERRGRYIVVSFGSNPRSQLLERYGHYLLVGHLGSLRSNYKTQVRNSTFLVAAAAVGTQSVLTGPDIMSFSEGNQILDSDLSIKWFQDIIQGWDARLSRDTISAMSMVERRKQSLSRGAWASIALEAWTSISASRSAMLLPELSQLLQGTVPLLR